MIIIKDQDFNLKNQIKLIFLNRIFSNPGFDWNTVNESSVSIISEKLTRNVPPRSWNAVLVFFSSGFSHMRRFKNYLETIETNLTTKKREAEISSPEISSSEILS